MIDEEIVNGMHEDDLEIISLMKNPQNGDLESQEWYQGFITELKDIVVETEFASRWALIEGRHLLGKRLLEEEHRFTNAGYLKMSYQVATSLNMSQRVIEQCIQFARAYPELELLPMGKNASWHKVCQELLPEHAQSKTKHVNRAELIQMLKDIKILLEHELEDTRKAVLDGDMGEEGDTKIDYIRYLQDQFNKITQEVNL